MYTPKGELNDKLYEMMKDEEAVKKLEAAKSPEDCYQIAKASAYADADVTFEDFMDSMKIMKSYLEESNEGILSEDDLDQVAGGKMKAEDAASTAIGTIGAGAAIGTAIATAFMA